MVRGRRVQHAAAWNDGHDVHAGLTRVRVRRADRPRKAAAPSRCNTCMMLTHGAAFRPWLLVIARSAAPASCAALCESPSPPTVRSKLNTAPMPLLNSLPPQQHRHQASSTITLLTQPLLITSAASAPHRQAQPLQITAGAALQQGVAPHRSSCWPQAQAQRVLTAAPHT